MSASPVDRLVSDSLAGMMLSESEAFREGTLAPAHAAEAAGQVRARPDASSFHLLLALRRAAPDAYLELPAEARAGVLVDALRTQAYLNDWGNLGPGGGYDGPAAAALLEAGEAARPGLLELLDDTRPAPLMGSEEASISKLYRYRRCDFAFRYLCLLDGAPAPFDPDPTARDAAIAALRARSRTPRPRPGAA